MNISAQIIADSLNTFGNRITTLKVAFPRYILAELNTHRAISKNSASSRAKPFKTMLKGVQDTPFIPVQWMKDHKGMQGNTFFTKDEEAEYTGAKGVMFNIQEKLEANWLAARDTGIFSAQVMSNIGLTKQIVNRLLEPFMMHEVLITATEWDNFFTLRCPRYEIKGDGNSHYQTVNQYFSRKDAISVHPELASFTDLQWRGINTGMADIHIMDLAEAIWDAMNESKPVELQPGEWHLPYINKSPASLLETYVTLAKEGLIDRIHPIPDVTMWDGSEVRGEWVDLSLLPDLLLPFLLKISAARCARISYKTFGEDSKIDILADIKLHDGLLEDQPIHASPAEHQGQSMTETDLENFFVCEDGEVRLGVCRNFVGFKQYRILLKNETIR